MNLYIQSDLHARLGCAQANYYRALNDGAMLIDCGDLEAPYISKDHPLRADPLPGEQTMDTIMRNAQQYSFDHILRGIETMSLFSAKANDNKIPYRAIAGNSEESWLTIFRETARGSDHLEDLF